jgi:hypothetical protein
MRGLQQVVVAEHMRCGMDVEEEKLDQVVLALLHLNSFKEGDGRRVWKSLPWSILDSLYEKGYISDPANKNKSVWLTEEGAKLSDELFERLFAAKAAD